MTPTPEQLRQTLAEAQSGVIRKQDLPRVIFALRLAEKVLEEPSEGMVDATRCGWSYDSVFRAMIQQAVKEVEDANSDM